MFTNDPIHCKSDAILGVQAIVAINAAVDDDDIIQNQIDCKQHNIEGNIPENQRDCNSYEDRLAEIINDEGDEAAGGYVLRLENAVFPDDILDEEETDEVLMDLCSLCQVFGDITAVWIEKLNSSDEAVDALADDLTSLSCTSIVLVENNNGDDSSTNPIESDTIQTTALWVMIEYESLNDAMLSLKALDGVCVGGETIQAYLYNYQAYLDGIFDDKYFLQCSDDPSAIVTPDGSDIKSPIEKGAVIAVKNYIFEEDVEECSGDSEELRAMKRDLLTLSSPKIDGTDTATESETFVKRVAIVSGRSISNENGDKKSNNTGGIYIRENAPVEDSLVTCVRYTSLSAASNAMLSLDGTLLGGATLKASICRSYSLKTSAECSTKSMEIVGETTEVEGRVLECTSTNSAQLRNVVAIKRFALPTPIDSTTANGLITSPGYRTMSKSAKKKTHTAPPVSVYKEAVLAPKLEKSSWSRRPIKVRTRTSTKHSIALSAALPSVLLHHRNR